jgi:hypothetical protein
VEPFQIIGILQPAERMQDRIVLPLLFFGTE